MYHFTSYKESILSPLPIQPGSSKTKSYIAYEDHNVHFLISPVNDSHYYPTANYTLSIMRLSDDFNSINGFDIILTTSNYPIGRLYNLVDEEFTYIITEDREGLCRIPPRRMIPVGSGTYLEVNTCNNADWTGFKAPFGVTAWQYEPFEQDDYINLL